MHDFSELHVLVADDSSYFRVMLRAMLRGFGIRLVSEVSDGADCLSFINERRPDLLFLDWEMPIFSGEEVMRQVRRDDSVDPYLPVIMITAHTERKRVDQAKKLGIHELLCKPIAAKSVYQRLMVTILEPRPFIRTDTYFGPQPREQQALANPFTNRPGVAPARAPAPENEFLL